MLRELIDWVRPPPIRELAALEAFAEREAARLTTKSTVVYCRIKASVHASKLFKEEGFRSALEICRWEAYGGLLADMLVVAEGQAREAAGEMAGHLADRLAGFYRLSVAADTRPGMAAQAESRAEEFRRRLARASMATPLPASEIATGTGNRIYDSIPIHKSLRREDRGVLVNQVRFGLVSFKQDLERRLDPTAIAADLARRSDEAR